MQRPHIAIIGAGIGGLSAAAVLSRHGRVSVFDARAATGGKIRQAPLGNRAIDSGPTVFTLKPVFDEIFSAAGRAFDDYVSVRPLQTLARHFWEDGSQLDLFSDLNQSASAIDAFAGPRAADEYRAFSAQAARDWSTLYGGFIRHAAPSLMRLSATSNPLNLIRLDPYTSYWRALCKRFTDPRLRQLFARYATYCGSSPFLAPATLSLIAHVERLGVWTIDGGMQGLANGLEQAARDNGAEFTFNSAVEHIDDRGRNARQITLENGTRLDVDAIIFNGDPAALTQTLASSKNTQATIATRPARSRASDSAKRSQSAITWSFLASRAGVSLSTHNVFFSPDYAAEFDDVLTHGRPPRDPTVYLFSPDAQQAEDENVQRNSDTAGEPPHDRYFALINAPANGDDHHYTNEEIEQCAKRMRHRLARCGLSLSIAPDPIDIQTPTSFSQRFPATQGALFGMPSHGWRAAFQRPGTRTKSPRIYRAGGGVHPGSGVPMAALSGLAAARALMRDCALT